MWYGILGTVLLDPYFFEEAAPTGFETYSLIASRYTDMLQNYVMPEMLQRNALNDIVWMQDSVPPHLAKSIHFLLEHYFSDRIISRPFRDSPI